jgi:hypothetical protein
MKQMIILLWVLWAQMLWIFGIPSIYFVRIGDWRAGVSIPLFVVTLYAGWRLWRRTRREWQQSG